MNIFINTVKSEVGDGSFENPYNYFDSILLTQASVEKIYITDNSVIKNFTLNDLISGKQIIGYTQTEVYWGDENLPNDLSVGPYIDASTMTFNKNIEEFQQALQLTNVRFYNWLNDKNQYLPIFNTSNVEYIQDSPYPYGWKKVTFVTT